MKKEKKKGYEVTDELYDYFISECKNAQQIFGLNGWRLSFKKRKMKMFHAHIAINYVARLATVSINTFIASDSDMPAKKILKQSAVHELAHLLLNEYRVALEYRYERDCVEGLEHAIVNIFESLVG